MEGDGVEGTPGRRWAGCRAPASARRNISMSFRREPRQEHCAYPEILSMIIRLYVLFEKLLNKWTQSSQCPRRQMHVSGPWYPPEKVHLFKGKKKA